MLDFPIDVLFTPVEVKRVAWGNITAPFMRPPGPDPNAIQELLKLLEAAERPVLILGTGARNVSLLYDLVTAISLKCQLQAVGEIAEMATMISLPVFHSPKYSTTFPVTHPFHAGSAMTLALLAAGDKPQPDLVILVGARTGFLLGGRSGAIVPTKSCKIAQIDIDGSETGRSEHVDLAIISDAHLAISALNQQLRAAKIETLKGHQESWLRTALGLKSWRAPHNETEPKINAKNGHLHPYHAVKKLLQVVPSSSILCIDGGECSGWALQNLPEASAALSMVCTGYLGFLGNGWGYSLGAAVADRTKLVVNIQGDGSAGFHIAELDTYKRFKLRVLTVIVNNSCWGMSQAGQEMIYGHLTPMRPAALLSEGTRYDIIAQGFGMLGLIIDATNTLPQSPLAERRKSWAELGPKDDDTAMKCLEGLGTAVDEIVQSGGPGLIDLRVSPKPYQDSTKVMVGATSDPDVVVVPYYDNLPRAYYKGKGEKL
jgi:thiamine pyrophosphate-dependent acetolactate synthase large subunit-like protein